MTLVQAAIKAIQIIGKPSYIKEILETILRHNLFAFNTPTPEHVLRTSIRRNTLGIVRVDSRDEVYFEMVGDEVYGIIEEGKTPMKKGGSSGIKRIHRAVDKEEIIQGLVSEKVGVFKEIWKLLLFSGNLGMARDRRVELKAVDTGRGIDQSTFGNSPAWPGVLFLMSLVETGKTEVLSGSVEAEDLRISIFQEYANGGLEILQKFFLNRPIDLDGFLAFLESQTIKPVSSPDLDLSI